MNKNNRYKLLILFLGIFLFTGCEANYNIKIMLDGTIQEQVIVKEKKDVIIPDFDLDKFKKMVNDSLRAMGINESVIRSKKYLIEDSTVGVDLVNSYSNIEEYKNKNKFLVRLYDALDIKNDGSEVIVETVGSNTDAILEDEYIDSYISVSVPFEVISSNADIVDQKNNIYKWKLEKNMDGIRIRYNKNKLFSSNISSVSGFVTASIYVKLIFIILLIIIFISSCILVRKNIRRYGQ